MSAFICNDYHISYIIEAGIRHKAWVNVGASYDYMTEQNAQHFYEVLKRENIRSVNRRYNKTTPALDLGFRCYVPHVSEIQALKAIACLEYQSCEHKEWETSHALKVLQAIKDAIFRDLPGYKEAAWEIQEPARV